MPETFTSAEHKDLKLRLKYIHEHFDELDDGSQEWAMKMETAYERQGWLSPRQLEIVDSIWEEV